MKHPAKPTKMNVIPATEISFGEYPYGELNEELKVAKH